MRNGIGPMGPGSKGTTTISTIAIKAGQKTRLTLAVLKSTDWVCLRVDEMQPSMLDVGSNEEEALSLQAQHADLMTKLQAKQSNIEQLLSKADQMVADQAEPEAVVYEAMAESLGAAWKELSRQLQLRASLLQHAVEFFGAVRKHTDQIDRVEKYLESAQRGDNTDAVNQIGQRREQLRLELLDVAVRVMTFGQLTIEKLREIGAFVDNEQRPRQTLEACARIEDVMLRVNDRRARLDSAWDGVESRLDLSRQVCQLVADLQRVEDWMGANGDTLQRTDLANSEASAGSLLREHERLLEEAKRLRDEVDRVHSQAERLASTGYDDGGQLVHRCRSVGRRLDELLDGAESRRQLLLAAVAFFVAAQSATGRLNALESEIRSLSLSRRGDTLSRTLAALCCQVEEAARPALAQGGALLRRAGSERGANGVAAEVTQLEKKVTELEQLCAANKAQALAASQKYHEFLQQYTLLHAWLVNAGEAFLYSNRDMGTTAAAATDFLDRHQQMAHEIALKETQVQRFLQWAGEIEGDPDDPDYIDVKRKTDDVRTRWDALKTAVQSRIDLATFYHKFHQQAAKHAADLDKFSAMVRTASECPTETAQRQLEEIWNSLSPSYEELKSQGDKFLVQSRLVTSDPALDVRTAQGCVETLLDHYANRHRTAREMWTQWRSKLSSDAEFRHTWNDFVKDCRRFIHYVSELQGDASLAFSQFEQPPALVAERQERALREFVPKADAAQRELEQLMRKAETLGAGGDTKGEKERITSDLLQTHRQLQQTVTQFEVLTTMTITFFKNLQQVDEWIERVQDKFQADRLPRHDAARMEQLVQEHDAASQTVEQLVRFARSQGQQIVHRANQPDVAEPVRRECDKIPRLVDDRTLLWERISADQRQLLQQHSHVAKFEKEIIEIFDTIETLRRNVRDMTLRLGESAEAAQTVSREFRDTERRVNQTDVRVRSVASTAEALLAGPFRGNQTLRQRTDELKQRWADFREELDDLTSKLQAASTYWNLVEETEEWMRETTDYIVDVGKKVHETRTSEDANQLMGDMERYMKPKQSEQEARMREMEKQATVLYGEEAEHKLQRQKKRYKEIVDSFVLVSDQLFSLAESYRTEEIRRREREEQQARRPAPVQPRFVQTLREREVVEGARVEFECQVTGFPQPRVEWFKDGVPIHNNPDYETTTTPYGVCVLKIEETFTEDSAVYTCRATNEAGISETAARLTVKETPRVRVEPPVFTKKLESVTVEETRSHKFECHVTGEPSPVVSWFKNEHCIDHSPSYQTSFNNGACVLKVEQTTLEDEARYTCRATNTAGDSSTSAKLTVIPRGGLQAPLFITPLQNVTVQKGETITLGCVVSGSPRPDVQWYQNNVPVRESRDVRTSFDGYQAALTIKEANPTHAGSYVVMARNRAGEATSTGFVTVLAAPPARTIGGEAPRIAPPLQSQTIVEGNRLMFETRITGDPPPDIAWYKDDGLIHQSGNTQILQDSYGWHRLVIDRLTKQDSGVYLVRATNPAGEAKSLATLQVNPPPAPATRTTQRVTEEFYETRGAFSPGAGAPSFARPLQDLQAPLGAFVRLDAVVTGSPRPRVTWLFNGQPITESTSGRQLVQAGDTYSLVIPQLAPEHMGTYSLVAENDRGTAHSSATLNAESRPPSRLSAYVSPVPGQGGTVGPKLYVEPPHFTQTLVSVVADEGDEARFEGVVTGIPLPEVTWYKDGKELREPLVRTSYSNGKASLVIPRVTTDHTGKYTCSGKNEGGLATSSAQLVVSVTKEAPDFVQRLISREAQEGTSLRWEVRVSGDPVPMVTWLRNNVPVQTGVDVRTIDEGRSVHVLHIPRLELSHTGQYTCKAENEAGEARSTADLIVRGKDDPPRVYYHVTRVYQQNHELGVEANRFHSGPMSDDEGSSASGRATAGVLL